MECDRKFQVVAFCVRILGPICEFLTTELSSALFKCSANGLQLFVNFSVKYLISC